MPDKIDDQMKEICDAINGLDFDGFDKYESQITDLKLKYVIAEALIDIRTQLFEISHYGIGTD